MDRREFVSTARWATMAAALAGSGNSAAAAPLQAASEVDGASDGPVLLGNPIVSGPAAPHITVLQPLGKSATGYLEYAVGEGDFQRVDAAQAGLLPFERYVLKFRLPPLPEGTDVRYRVVATPVSWAPVGKYVHGRIQTGEPHTSSTFQFRTLDSSAQQTSFVVWNDTHENAETLRALQQQTSQIQPDFLLWNGDQTNDVHFEKDMVGQFLAPEGLPIADQWPLAYARGNHDVRGPAARHVAAFTGTPHDAFYYAFRSGPVAAIVMDTGEDKPDDSPYFAGLAAFQPFRERQARWLEAIVEEPWFREAPHRVLFCHMPLWWVRDRKDIDWWEFSKVSRDVWLPGLKKGQIQVVLSGHTHEFKWMPPASEQPIGQLIGGGPHPASATLIHGTATAQTLTLRMQKLDGTLVQELEFPAVV